MTLEKFIISYQIGSESFHFNDRLFNRMVLTLKNQNDCDIYVNEFGINFNVDFFLVENIFYWFDKDVNTYYFSNHRMETWVIDDNSKGYFDKNGFYYLSTSPFKGVRVLLSFLKYSFGSDVVICSLLEKITQTMGTFQNIVNCFQTEIYTFRDNIKSKYLLPLSGGMDSRLILEFFLDDPNLLTYTHGEIESGDVRIVKEILNKFPLKNHRFIDISLKESLDLRTNASKCDFFLPPERLMYPLVENVYPDDTFIILSGLYGEHVFSDQNSRVLFSNFIKERLVVYEFDNIDQDILKCYSQNEISEKLAFILLRCQKLTKQSLNMTDSDCFIPFLKNSVLASVENYDSNGLYPKLIKTMMRKKLRLVLHQTSLSHFTYPKWYRSLEKIFYKLVYTRYKKPYFSQELTKILVNRN
jgi:hypothetical protein